MKALIIHGGAGRITEPRREALEALKQACQAGLSQDNPLDMAVEAVASMEDSGVFNAGVGSSLNLLGEREMDAGVMDSSGRMGAVAAVRYPRNPVKLARDVALKTSHILLAGPGADQLAMKLKHPRIPPPPREVVEKYETLLESYLKGEYPYYKENLQTAKLLLETMDTVGAAALHGDSLAAATSTGGVWLKLPGRVGDTPIPGAGFLATTRLAASATGLGEAIIRATPLYKLDNLLAQEPILEKAARRLEEHIMEIAGTGAMGLIAITPRGEALIHYNTQGIYTAWCTETHTHATLLTQKTPQPATHIIKLSK